MHISMEISYTNISMLYMKYFSYIDCVLNLSFLLCRRACRHTVVPAPELLGKVFPGLDAMHEWAKKQATECTSEADISAFGFTSALMMLRVSFLQASVIVKDCEFLQCQDIPLWSNELFTDPLYLKFAENMKTVLEQHKAVSNLICEVVPVKRGWAVAVRRGPCWLGQEGQGGGSREGC